MRYTKRQPAALGVVSSAWEGLRGSRMALLAVNALLLSTLSCRVAATMSREASGPAGRVVALGRSIVTLPSRRLVAGDAVPPRVRARCAGEPGKLLGRRRNSDSVAEVSCKEAKGSAGNRIRGLAKRRAGQAVHDASITSTIDGSNNNGGRSSSSSSGNRSSMSHAGLLLPMWIHTRQEGVKPSAKDEFVRIVSGVREAVGWAGKGGGETLQQGGGLGTSRRRRQRVGANSNKDGRETQQRPRGARPSTGASPAVETPPRTVTSTSSASSADATAAVTDATAVVVPAAPVPSYLRWTSRGDTGSNLSGEQKGGGKRGKVLSMGKGNRGEGSDEETAASSGGSLGTAKSSRGGGGSVSLTFGEAMFAGAISRSIAQTCMQPANVVKTLLQGRGTSQQLSNLSFKLLTRGAGAQFVMSLPHGACNFATLEIILGCSAKMFPSEWRERAGPVLDFLSSSVATMVCSVVSTPQMVITDRIMAGMYPNMVSGVREIVRTEGLGGFYTGWSANVAQKIPSYGLTWVFFQQFKRLHRKATERPPTNTENFVLGAAAAGATVCIMIPLDTVKTRLVTQTAQAGVVPYKGVLRTLSRVVREEGLGPIYRSLTPRLVSVVPMIGIQFGIYECIRRELMSRKEVEQPRRSLLPPVVRRALGKDVGSQQPDFVKDFLRNVCLLEEELL